MKKRMISIVGWSSVLFILLGVCLFIGISARDISVARVGVAILPFTLAACANIVAKKKRAFRFVRPPIQLRIYLYGTRLICIIVAILLEILDYVRGVPMIGHSLFDTAEHICVSLAVIVLVINILVIVVFFCGASYLIYATGDKVVSWELK